MTFSEQVKNELCRIPLDRECCAQAEAYGILLCSNTFTSEEIRIVTEHNAFAQRLPALFRRAFRLCFDCLPCSPDGKKNFRITDRGKLRDILAIFGQDPGELSHHINFAVLEESCCRAAFLRGIFLAGGSVTDPLRSYHLELATSHLNVGRELKALMWEMNQEPKLGQRKGYAIIYFKQSDRVADFLTAIGAPLCAMELMNTKLEKDLRGSVNRRVNCDAANVDKAVEAALIQREAIARLEKRGTLDSLPDKLQEAARLRREHPADTLAQLAERCSPPVSKSALNHRLRRLVELSREEEPDHAASH